jgi:tetratricopeptide (TPR) repeat protein
MLRPTHLRRLCWSAGTAACLLAACLLLASPLLSLAQNSPADNPAQIPAGAIPAQPPQPVNAAIQPALSSRQVREADDAYLEGARQVEHKNLEAAQASFQRAVQLAPGNRDYALALIVTREQRLTQLVQLAAKARLKGDDAKANALLDQAQKLDPDNPIIAQHFATDDLRRNDNPTSNPLLLPADEIASTLGGPVEFQPAPGKKSFHQQGDAQSLLRLVYNAFGIQTTFDPSVPYGNSWHLDLDNVDFAEATRVLNQITHVFAVPVQPHTALLVKDSLDNRNLFQPQIEETIYLPGVPADQMTELANLARNVFDLTQVTASATGGNMLLRGPEDTLHLVNATFADILDGGSDVLFDVRLYEIDRTTNNNIGATLPAYAGVFSIAAEAQSLISANQTLINQAVAAGVLTLSGTPLQNEIKEIEFLIASGAVSASQYTNLLGTFGGGLAYAGLFLGSNSDFSLLLNSSDVRTLDAVQLRGGNHQPASFQAGERYPIVTATYSSGISSSLASQVSGLTVNGTSVSSLLSQYLGSTQTTIPQIQYEDLGITLKLTPQILHGGDVQLLLDLKIEALAGGTIDSIPILNSRAMTSTITVPAGQTALLASLVDTNESKAIEGLPGLSELPGFQGTDQNINKSSDELLITITPHIVRPGAVRITSRALLTPHTPAPQ